MDIWFTLFVTVVALVAAGGFALALVGYINVLPAGFSYERKWIRAIAIVPALIVGLPFVVAVVIEPFTHFATTPTTLARWLAIPAGVLHLGALGLFLRAHWGDQKKTGQQLLAGLLLMAIAAGLLYGFGPGFAARIVEGLK